MSDEIDETTSRERMRMSTNQIQIMNESRIKLRMVELVGGVALVILYLVARVVEKHFGISVLEVMTLLGLLTGKLMGKPADKVTEYAFQSLPPRRMQEIYQKAVAPRPTRGEGVITAPTLATPPLKRQPHHEPPPTKRPRTPTRSEE